MWNMEATTMIQNETWMDISSGIPQPSAGDTAAGWETAGAVPAANAAMAGAASCRRSG